jgi:hypothetical protein
MTFDEISTEAADIAAKIEQLKARAMIYQVTEKECLAKLHGLPLDAYYELTYGEWALIRDGENV